MGEPKIHLATEFEISPQKPLLTPLAATPRNNALDMGAAIIFLCLRVTEKNRGLQPNTRCQTRQK